MLEYIIFAGIAYYVFSKKSIAPATPTPAGQLLAPVGTPSGGSSTPVPQQTTPPFYQTNNAATDSEPITTDRFYALQDSIAPTGNIKIGQIVGNTIPVPVGPGMTTQQEFEASLPNTSGVMFLNVGQTPPAGYHFMRNSPDGRQVWGPSATITQPEAFAAAAAANLARIQAVTVLQPSGTTEHSSVAGENDLTTDVGTPAITHAGSVPVFNSNQIWAPKAPSAPAAAPLNTHPTTAVQIAPNPPPPQTFERIVPKIAAAVNTRAVLAANTRTISPRVRVV